LLPAQHIIFTSNAPLISQIYNLSLHDALPICLIYHGVSDVLPPWPPIRRKFHDKIAALADANDFFHYPRREYSHAEAKQVQSHKDRKSTRLNSSHVKISYAVFCLKKKKQNNL